MIATASLYLCYQSVAEPLTQTQVVAYLEGLARSGYRIVLLTFEARPLSSEETDEWRSRLASKGITWTWLRYHKQPTAPATAWDILMGIMVGLGLIRKYHVRLVHARAHVPGLMAWTLKKLTGVKFLFDIRGFMAEEYVDAGVWPANGLLFRITKRVERFLVQAADALVVLTGQAQRLLDEWYPNESRNKPIQVIPCCVDLRGKRLVASEEAAQGTSHESLAPAIVYAGKLGGWYLSEAMVAFAAVAARALPGLRWQIWTQSDPAKLREALAAHGLNGEVSIGRVASEELPDRLTKADAGLSFIKPCVSKLASSPTKVGEYLAAGLPVVSTRGIGDVDELLAGDGKPVGVLLEDLSEQSYREAAARLLDLLRRPDIRARCRAAAEKYLDLENVGWKRYRNIYRNLIGPSACG